MSSYTKYFNTCAFSAFANRMGEGYVARARLRTYIDTSRNARARARHIRIHTLALLASKTGRWSTLGIRSPVRRRQTRYSSTQAEVQILLRPCTPRWPLNIHCLGKYLHRWAQSTSDSLSWFHFETFFVPGYFAGAGSPGQSCNYNSDCLYLGCCYSSLDYSCASTSGYGYCSSAAGNRCCHNSGNNCGSGLCPLQGVPASRSIVCCVLTLAIGVAGAPACTTCSAASCTSGQYLSGCGGSSAGTCALCPAGSYSASAGKQKG